MDRVESKAPYVLLALALAAGAALILALTWHLTFYQDTFEFLMNRRGFTVDALLKPHNEHIVVIPVAIEQLFLHLFGMTTARPEYVLLTAGLVGCAGLVFVYVKRRIGPWMGLFAAVLLLCLGPAWEVLLWPFEIGFVGSIFFGLATLLALERRDRTGDVLACVALVCSLGFSSLGIPFAIGAVVAILQRPRAAWRRSAFAVVVPIVLYGLWYVGWGHEAENHMSLHNVLISPRYVVEAIAVGLGSLFGLGNDPISGGADPVWGRAMLVAALVLLVARQVYRRVGFFPGFWPAAAAAATNWFLTAFNYIPGREPIASRYQYATCVFIVLLLANLLYGLRFSRRALIVGGVVTVLAIAPNLVVLNDGKDVLREQTTLTRADTGALDIARRTVDPSFELSPAIAGTPSLIDVFAGKYLEAVDEFGSPGYSPAELEAAPELGRKQADIVLAQALPLATATTTGRYDPVGGENCVAVGGGEGKEVAVGPGTTRIEVAPGPHAGFSLRRFAVGEYPVVTEGAPGESTTVLTIPRDEAEQPWYLLVEASQAARVCR
jgi:hypothetical protein